MKNIIVTGTSRGIGFEIIRALARFGSHKILAISRDEINLNTLKTIVERESPESMIEVCPFDISSTDFTIINQIAFDFFGFADEGKLDVLINNAGYLVNKPFVETTDQDWHEMMEVNLMAQVRLINNFYPFFNRNLGSHIVNISSMGGVQGATKFPGISAYSVTKGAVNILSEALATEFKKEGIRVNAISPGAVQTAMLEQAFPGYKARISPTEMGEFIARFALESGNIINGKIIQASLDN